MCFAVGERPMASRAGFEAWGLGHNPYMKATDQDLRGKNPMAHKEQMEKASGAHTPTHIP